MNNEFLSKSVILIIAVLNLVSCTGQVSRILSKKEMTQLQMLDPKSPIQMDTNSTSTQLACSNTNQIKLIISISGGSSLYCRDKSMLMDSYNLGQNCSNGPTITNIATSPKIVPCDQMVVCGQEKFEKVIIAKQFDDSPIYTFTFNNLPWACHGKIEYSKDVQFTTTLGTIEFNVTPPACNYCPRTDSFSCATCDPLGSDEMIVAGQIIPKTCPAKGGCQSCNVIGGTSILHGGTANFYSHASSQCGQPCSQISQTKVCNNGKLTGDSTFSFTQCLDVKNPSCLCSLASGKTIPTSDTSVKLYKLNPTCNLSCSDISQYKEVICDNGILLDTNWNPLSLSDIQTFAKLQCANTDASVCVNSKSELALNSTHKMSLVSKSMSANCNVNSSVISNGSSYTWYKIQAGTCSNKCANNSLSRTCSNGAFTGDSSYSYPSCSDSACTCFLSIDNKNYDSGAQLQLNKSDALSCGHRCSDADQIKVIICDNGSWKDSNQNVIPLTVFNDFPFISTSCHDPVCNCPRVGRNTVPDDGKTHNVFSVDAPACGSTCNQKQGAITCSAGQLSGDIAFGFDSCTNPICACSVALDGGNIVSIAEGSSIVLSSVGQNTPSLPNACTDSSKWFTVKCVNHNLTPNYDSSIYKYLKDSCLTNDYTCKAGIYKLNYNTLKTFYKTDAPGCGVSCQNLDVYCDTGGTLVLNSDKKTLVTAGTLSLYPATNCNLKDCSCPINGYILPFLGSKDFYSISSGGCDPNACNKSKVTLTCGANKSISGGDPSLYQYTNCSTQACSCNLGTGASVPSGKSTTLFSVDKATCSTPKACDDAKNKTTVSCSNGVLSNYDSSIFKYSSCAPAICSCAVNNIQLDFNKDAYFYKTNKPTGSDTCASVAAHFTCLDGGNVKGDKNEDIANFPSSTCSSLTDQGNLGGTGGGSGNDEGPGSAIRKRMGLPDQGGSAGGGPSYKATHLTNIALDGDFFQKLENCILPWGNGEIEHFGSIIAFDQKCVTKPDSCAKHKAIRSCKYPQWTGDSKFKFPTCKEKTACP